MKLVAGLGNPGPRYDATRHNVGWWLVDRLRAEWGFGAFEQGRHAMVAAGSLAGEEILLVKPITWMNRSGVALAPARTDPDLDIGRDLLVVVDDVALDAGRVRFRPGGSAGGHNGLKSVEAALGTQDYARLRIGVGGPPAGVELADWVLSAFEPADEQAVLDLMPSLAEGVRIWVEEGIDAAMSRCNR